MKSVLKNYGQWVEKANTILSKLFERFYFFKVLELIFHSLFIVFSPLPEDDDDRSKRPSFPTSPTKSVTPTSSPTKSKLEEHPITRQTISLPAAERLIGSSASAGAVVTARSGFKNFYFIFFSSISI